MWHVIKNPFTYANLFPILFDKQWKIIRYTETISCVVTVGNVPVSKACSEWNKSYTDIKKENLDRF